ncbi:MAG: hypothetical protein K2X45_00280, partial [Phreatobacter sp.]|nr:hypothetical protein [Phreatobacter sp.]
MAGRSSARRTDTGRSHPARLAGRVWPEAALAGPRGEIAAEMAAVLTLAPKPPHQEPLAAAAPPVVVTGGGTVATAAPAVEIAPVTAMQGGGSAPVPTIAGAAAPARRMGGARGASLAVITSLILHVAAAAAIAWLSWTAPPPISAGEEGIPVELVVAADTGVAAQQEAASGRHETESSTTDSQPAQKVEVPPVETPPKLSASDPVETPSEDPPVAQPDPLTTAERILDQLPPPPVPELLPIVDRPAGPILAEARSQPMTDVPAPQPATLPDAAQAIETPEPSEVQATVAPPPVEQPSPVAQGRELQTPPPAPPVQQLETPPAPPVRREATRPPPTRREAPTTQERHRPTR